MDEDLGSTWAQKQDSSSESVPVAVEFLCAHGGEQTGKHAADVPIHSLQRYIQTLSWRLVQKDLQSTDICKT